MIGVLGILGTKRMEYSRMMGLVEHMSGIVSRALEEWGGDATALGADRERPKA